MKLSEIIRMIEDEIDYEIKTQGDIPHCKSCEQRICAMVMTKLKGCIDPFYLRDLYNKTYVWMIRG